MARRYLWRTWVACAALLVLSASAALGAGGDDQGQDNNNQGQNDNNQGQGKGNKNLKGTYTFRLVPATSFAPFVAGSGVESAPRQDILRVGVFTADGNGNLTGRTIATTDDG